MSWSQKDTRCEVSAVAETAAKLSALSRCINKPPDQCVCGGGVGGSHQEVGELSEHTLHVLLFPSLISAPQAFPPCTALRSITQMTQRCTCDSARVACTPPAAVQRRSFWRFVITFISLYLVNCRSDHVYVRRVTVEESQTVESTAKTF